MGENKQKSTTVASYLVSEKGTKYLKFGPRLDKNKNVVGENPFPLVINEGDILFVNIFDEDFRGQHNIPDFVRGRVEKAANQNEEPPKKSKDENTF